MERNMKHDAAKALDAQMAQSFGNDTLSTNNQFYFQVSDLNLCSWFSIVNSVKIN